MGMYSLRSYRLTRDEYNYLLPLLRKKLSSSNDNYYFCGDGDDLDDMLSRLKGCMITLMITIVLSIIDAL